MMIPSFRNNESIETVAQKRARSDAATAEEARRHFDLVAGKIAASRPFDPETEQMDDLDMLEAATAASTRNK